jgi:hypothetical protein
MKRAIAIFLAAILVSFACPLPADARARSEGEQQAAARIKIAISKLGTGPTAYVELKLTDGTKLKGYVDEASEKHFVVINAESGESKTVPYGQVKHVKGNNLSTGAKVAIGVGVGLAVVLLILKDRIKSH